MILPLGDAPNPRGVPFVTYALIAANVAVYVLISLPLSVQPASPRDPVLAEYVRVIAEYSRGPVSVRELTREVSAYDLFVFTHGFRAVEPSLVTLLTSLFLHAGFAHLFGNMLFLWIYGDNVEHRLGRVPYLLAYLGTGVAATLFYTLFAADSPLPLVGASGAISGILGFYYVWFPRNQVRLLVLLFPLFMNTIMVPARLVLGMFLILDNLLPFMLSRGAGGGVAYGAHIGGFIAGWVVAKLMDRREVAAQPARDIGVQRVEPADEGAEVHELIRDGQFNEAATRYFARDPRALRAALQPEDSLGLADWLRQHGHPEHAAILYRRQLRDFPHGAGAAAAHLGLGLIQLEFLDQPTPAYQHFLEALDLDPPADVAARARAALAEIAARQKFQVGRPRA